VAALIKGYVFLSFLSVTRFGSLDGFWLNYVGFSSDFLRHVTGSVEGAVVGIGYMFHVLTRMWILLFFIVFEVTTLDWFLMFTRCGSTFRYISVLYSCVIFISICHYLYYWICSFYIFFRLVLIWVYLFCLWSDFTTTNSLCGLLVI
jgi:hypothetical protein